MFERFTDRARRVVVLAQEEARLLNHNYIGTEHLLLGLVHSGEGIGAQALADLGVSLQGVRREVEEIIGTGGSAPEGGHIPFTPRAKKVLELALREALNLGHNYIGTEHILLGLVREGEGVAAQVLIRRGLDLATVRAKVLELLGQLAAGEPGAFGVEIRAGGQAPFYRPRCPRCSTALEGNLRTVPLEAPPLEGVPGAQALPLVAVWCGACGTTLALLPPPA